MIFALIGTFTGLSQSWLSFHWKAVWYLRHQQKKEKKQKKRTKRRRREIQSKQMTQKTTFFWWTHWTKSHVSSVSQPKSVCQDRLPLTLIPKYLLRRKSHRGQHLKCSKEAGVWAVDTKPQEKKQQQLLTTEQNAPMNKLRQRSNRRKQERVIAGYNNNTPDTETAHRNSSDTVSGRLISRLLCLCMRNAGSHHWPLIPPRHQSN